MVDDVFPAHSDIGRGQGLSFNRRFLPDVPAAGRPEIKKIRDKGNVGGAGRLRRGRKSAQFFQKRPGLFPGLFPSLFFAFDTDT
jgi:hypothetical protein